MHINELELLALKLALETFLKVKEIESLHIQMDKIVALNYFLKKEVATNAFSITWNKEFYYAFPPFFLIIQVLNKIKKDKPKN